MMLTFWRNSIDNGRTIGEQSLQKYVTDKKRFYLPKNLVDKFDGHTLWFNITEDEAYNKYRDIEEPHVKN